MGSGSDIACVGSATSKGKLTPFAQVLVTLTKEEHIKLRSETHYWKSPHRQVLARMEQLKAEHCLAMEEAAQREAALRSELEKAEGKIRDLQKRLFGRKSERSSSAEKNPAAEAKLAQPRGQRPGAPGHGRTLESDLPIEVETVELDCPHCPKCGLGYADFPAQRTAKSSRSTSNLTGGRSVGGATGGPVSAPVRRAS